MGSRLSVYRVETAEISEAGILRWSLSPCAGRAFYRQGLYDRHGESEFMRINNLPEISVPSLSLKTVEPEEFSRGRETGTQL